MGILKKKRKQATKPTKVELQSILAGYKRQTAEITDETAIDMMDTEKKNDFLLLLKIADYVHMGKSWAILTLLSWDTCKENQNAESVNMYGILKALHRTYH